MKKISLVAGVLLFSLQFAFAQVALLHDSFEVSYDGWFANGDYAKITAHPGAGYNMSRGMKITDRHSSAEGAMSEKGFYLSGGEEYEYSVFVRHEKPTTETYKLTLRWLYPDGVTYGSKVIATVAVPSGKWASLTAKFTAPQNMVNLTLSITTNSTADFFFDDVKVTGKQTGSIKAQAKTLADVGLKDIYAGYFRIGSVLNSGTVNNTAIKNLILKEFNSITAENEMKPDQTMNQSGSTNTNISVRLNGAASILKFCSDNKIGVRGHTLVWHAQTPEWFFKDNFQNSGSWASKAVMKQRLESYIKNLFALIKEQYPNLDLYAYDVVNEAVEQPNRPGCGRTPGYNDGKSPWVQIYGDNSFIEDAFTYARQYAPSTTKLFYNDFNEFAGDKRDCIINNILKPLKQKGVLDGMGMQSHLGTNPNAWGSTASYVEALDKYVNVGIQVQITELDVSTEAGNYTLYQQAQRYKSIFQKAIDRRSTDNGATGVTAVVVWGPNDANSWVGTDDKTGKSNAPLLFDKDNNRKPAWDTVAALVPKSNWDTDTPASSSSRVASSSSRAASSSSIAVSSSSRAVSSSSTGPTTCEYRISFCGGLPYSSVLSNSTTIPKVGECLYIGDFSIIQPYLNSTVAINGLENTFEDEWLAYNERPERKDDGYYVYVKAGKVNDNTDNAPEIDGWRGIVAKEKPGCTPLAETPTPIINHSLIATSHSTITYYSLKGEPLGNAKPQKAGVYIVKHGNSVKKIAVR